MRPELPFLAAGAVAVIGSAYKNKKWPDNAGPAIIGTVVLVLVASASTNTRLGPLVHAIGLLLLLAAILAAVKTAQQRK